MAVTKFIAKIWEARLLANFHKISSIEAISTAPSEIRGNTIVFGNVSEITVGDYEGSVSYQELDITDVELEMDQKKYWAFKVNDVDKVQASGELIDPHMLEAAYSMEEAIEKVCFAKMAQDAGTKLGNKSVTPLSAYDLIVDLSTQLNKNKVPKTERYCLINSDYLGLLSKDKRFTDKPNVLENGVVEGAKIAGFTIIVTEELPADKGRTTIIGMQRLGLGFGKQLNETEAMRLEGSFADGVRGLCVFGAKALKAQAVVTANVAIGSAGITGITLNATTMSIVKGNTETLIATVQPVSGTNSAVTYTSSDPAKATVDEDGVVTGKAAGEATITVASVADPTKTATCTVTVTAS